MNFIKILLPTFLILVGITVSAQSISTVPEYPTDEGEVVLTFNAIGSDLQGYDGKLYTHCGVTVDGNEWQYVIGQWGVNTSQPELTNLGGDLWELVITPSIRDFWSVPSSGVISELSMVFRSEDSETQSPDMFVDVYESGLSLIITEPYLDRFLATLNQEILVEATAPNADSLFLYVNDELKYETDMISFSYNILADNFGSYWTDVWVKVIAKDATEMVADSFAYVVIPDPVVEELPAGIIDGINYIDDNTVVLSLFAPLKETAFVVGDFNSWEVNEGSYMKQTPDETRFWLQIDNLIAGQEYIFQYFVDGWIKVGDPFADKVSDPWNDHYINNATYPNLIDYPDNEMVRGVATVLQTAQEPYVWQVENFTPPAVEDMVVYECLIRDFTALHTYQSLTDTIDYFKRLGINVLELMPVSEFEGNLSWGYNPSYYFAPDKYYGPKDKLKELIDVCHQNGIAVVLDMVLNHSFWTSPYVQMYWDVENSRPTEDSPFYNPIPKHDFNVGFDFNHESPATRAFAKRVNKYWLEEYKFDGFRFDLSKGFTQKNTLGNTGQWGQYDQTRIDIWDDYSSAIWDVNPNAYVILEHFAENSEEKVLANNGMMPWGNLNYNYTEGTMGWTESGKSNIDWISYQVRGYNDPHVVGYIESHDEERNMFKNVTYGRMEGGYNITDTITALERAALAANFFIPIPGPKMIWQFGEMGYDYSINWPTGTDESRTDPKPPRWDYLEDYQRNYLFSVYAALIELKKEYDVFATTDFSLDVYNKEKVIVLRHSSMDVVVVGNFGMESNTITPNWPETGKWYEFYTQTEYDVNSSNQSLDLERGEYRLYSNAYIEKPEWLNTGIDGNMLPTEGFTNVYPNPSTGDFTFTFDKHAGESVEVNIFDVLGNKVAALSNSNGQSVTWNPKELCNGFYFARITMGQSSEVIKLIIE